MKKWGGVEEGEGEWHVQNCPLCGASNNARFYPSGKMHCCPMGRSHHCDAGWSGGVDIFHLVQHKQGISFPEALTLIARESGFEMFIAESTETR